jgi:hypothetical protein
MASSSSPDDEVVLFEGAGSASVRPHLERFIGTNGSPILIECDCPIGREHTYAEWLARFTRDGM